MTARKKMEPTGGQISSVTARDSRKSIASLLRNTHRLYTRGLLNLTRDFGVTTVMQWWVLRTLWNEDGQTQRSLSDRIGLYDSGIVAVLDALEDKGLVARSRNQEDRRKVNIHLTEAGRALEKQLLPLADSINGVAESGLSLKQRGTLWDMLNLLNDNLETHLAKRPS